MDVKNLFADVPTSLPHERFEQLLCGDGWQLERIISAGHVTPPGQWYDQETDEWVALLSGAARLRFEYEPQELSLRPGDHLLLPAHRRHRVEWTDPHRLTVWLALHFRSAEAANESLAGRSLPAADSCG